MEIPVEFFSFVSSTVDSRDFNKSKGSIIRIWGMKIYICTSEVPDCPEIV